MSEANEGSQLPVRAGGASGAMARPGSGGAVATFEQFEPATSPLEEYLGLLLRRKWTVLVCAVVVFGATCLVTAMLPRSYEATATLLVSEAAGARVMGGEGEMPPMMAAMAAPSLETHAELLQGESTARETALWLKKQGGPVLSPGAIRGSIRAKAVPNTQLMRLSARAPSPEGAEEIARAAAFAYVATNRRRARGSSESASRYLSEQLTVGRMNLVEAENALRAFKESTGTTGADAAAGELLSRTASLGADQDRTKANLAQARERLAKVRAQLGDQNRSIMAGKVRNNTALQDLRTRLVVLEGERLEAEARYAAGFSLPREQIEEQTRIVREQLEGEVRNMVRSGSGDVAVQQALTGELFQGEAEVSALEARERLLRAELGEAQVELKKTPARQITLARLQRQVEVAQNIHSDLLRRSQEIEVGRVMALGNADVVEAPSQPLFPVKPNVPLNLAFGLVLGLGLGVGLALLQEQLDDTVRHEEDVSRLAEAPVLGTVPLFQEAEGTGRLALATTQGRAIEAYRALRYSLSFVTPGSGGRTVLVTSPGPEEGKSVTSLNLAMAAALSGRRTVLVDGDLRRPALHRLLNLNGSKGMTDLLAGEAELAEVIQSVPETELRFISAGSRAPNPTDLLDSARMRALIEGLREETDLIIFDSPPVLSVADSLVLAGLSDAVLLVCVPGVSHRRALQRARVLLAHIGHSVSGVVLNKVEQKPGYGYYYGYYYYYDRGAEGDESGPEES